MSTTYRISDVAERTGFAATTLRYYEEIGLLPTPPRTAAGYRLYDDATVERLAFIARAKQLGCGLDEIGELVTAWEGGRCGPVQDRLRALVTDKLAAIRRQRDELDALATDLRRALDTLTTDRPDAPCDDACGCVSDPDVAGGPGAGHAQAVAFGRRAERPPAVGRPVLDALLGRAVGGAVGGAS